MTESAMGRRELLRYSAAGVVLATAAGASPGNLPEPDCGDAEPVTTRADVLVVGGGAAGTIAAIQAARAGADTFLVERGTQLGGTTTTAGVSFPGLFDAWGKQIIAGIGWELVRECVELDGGTLPDFSKVPERHWMNQVRVNPFLYALLAEEKCAQAGVRIAYYEFPQRITATDAGWRVDCAGFGTRRQVHCKQIIDCTGGAEAAGLLNLSRLRGEETQPGSLLYLLDAPNTPGRPAGALESLYVHGADSTNSRTVTAANLEGRRFLLEKVRREKKRLTHLQPETGFRESYRIEGETVVTVDDYTSGRMFADAVCYAFYPVDLHTRDGITPKPLRPGVVPTIPLGALIPKDSRNIMVAGRCVSSDRLANSGLRVQASCMAMGQVAGVAAALAARDTVTPRDVALGEIRKALRMHGAIVPPDAALG